MAPVHQNEVSAAPAREVTIFPNEWLKVKTPYNTHLDSAWTADEHRVSRNANTHTEARNVATATVCGMRTQPPHDVALLASV